MKSTVFCLMLIGVWGLCQSQEFYPRFYYNAAAPQQTNIATQADDHDQFIELTNDIAPRIDTENNSPPEDKPKESTELINDPKAPTNFFLSVLQTIGKGTKKVFMLFYNIFGCILGHTFGVLEDNSEGTNNATRTKREINSNPSANLKQLHSSLTATIKSLVPLIPGFRSQLEPILADIKRINGSVALFFFVIITFMKIVGISANLISPLLAKFIQREALLIGDLRDFISDHFGTYIDIFHW